MEWLSGLWSGAGNALSSLGNADTMKSLGGLGQFAGGMGQAYGAYNQGKMAKDLIGFEKQQYSDWQDNQKKNSSNLETGFNNSSYGKRLGSYAGV